MGWPARSVRICLSLPPQLQPPHFGASGWRRKHLAHRAVSCFPEEPVAKYLPASHCTIPPLWSAAPLRVRKEMVGSRTGRPLRPGAGMAVFSQTQTEDKGGRACRNGRRRLRAVVVSVPETRRLQSPAIFHFLFVLGIQECKLGGGGTMSCSFGLSMPDLHLLSNEINYNHLAGWL